jgi:hypothetical protein
MGSQQLQELFTMRAAILRWIRMEMQHPLVAMETDWPVGRGYFLADIVVVTKKGLLMEIELKRSIEDLRADKNKLCKHAALQFTLDARAPRTCDNDSPELMHLKNGICRTPARFYYAVPHELLEKARAIVDASYPYAGLMSIAGMYRVAIHVLAPQLHNRILDAVDQWDLVKAQSSTLVRMAMLLAESGNPAEIRTEPATAMSDAAEPF